MIQKILTVVGILLFIFLLVSGGWLINRVSSPPVDPSSSDSSGTSEENQDIPEEKIVKQQEDLTLADEKANQSVNQDIQAAVSSVVESARDLFVEKDMKIVAVGDSLTQGVGDDTGNGGYVGIVEDMIETNSSVSSFEIKNYGKRGNRTDQLIKRLKQPELSREIQESDIVLVTIGANDIMKVVKSNFSNLTYEEFHEETDNYRKRLEQVFEQIRTANDDASIYLIGVFNPFNTYFSDIPELDQIVKDWNTIGREIVREDENALFVPIHDLFEGAGPKYYAEDRFHPNGRGYALIADRVFTYLEPELDGENRGVVQSEELEKQHEKLAEQN